MSRLATSLLLVALLLTMSSCSADNAPPPNQTSKNEPAAPTTATVTATPAPAPEPAPAPKATTTIDIRRGKAPTIDGIAEPQEWDDAGSAEITIAPDWKAKAFYKHDDSHLYFMFSGIKKEDGVERYVDILLDMEYDRASIWKSDDWWLHVSNQDCEGRSVRNQFYSCAPEQTGWSANNFGLDPGEVVEVQIDYAKVGLTASPDRKIGVAFDLTDTRRLHTLWPPDADQRNPSTWAEAVSSDGWK